MFGLFSCKKIAIEENPDYIGRWLEADYCKMELTFHQSGKASYMNRKQETDCDRGRAGGKAKIKESTIILSSAIITHRQKFFIDLPPTLIDTIEIPTNYYPRDPPVIPEKSIMKMILNGNTFYKVLE